MNCDPTSVARSCASGTPSASVIGPKTSRTRRSRIMPMAASLVSAERSMAMRRTRVSGGSQDSRKVRTTVAPTCSGPAASAAGQDLTRRHRQLQRLGEQRLLRPEVVDDEGGIDRRARRDVADRRAVVAVLGERRARGLQDAVARGGVARAAAAPAAAASRGSAASAGRPGAASCVPGALIRRSSARRPRRPRRARSPPGARSASSRRVPRARRAAGRSSARG